MSMAWTTSMAAEMPEVITKLSRLANGDVELVHRAIRAVKIDDQPADLEKVVQFIVQHRRDRPRAQSEKVA